MNKSFSLLTALIVCAGAHAQVIATDNAEHAAYTTDGPYTGLNGGTGAWDPIGWLCEGWDEGPSPVVKLASSTLNMGSRAFTTNGATGGGADSRRRLQDPLPIGGAISWSMALDPNCSSGEFYVDIRSGLPGSSGQRDMLLLIGEVGANWRISGQGIVPSTVFTEVPFVLGQRVDGTLLQTALNTYDLTLKPFGGTAQTISGNFYTTGVQVQVMNFSNWGLNSDAYFNNLFAAIPLPTSQSLTGTLVLNNTVASFAFNTPIAYQVKQGTTTLGSGSITASGSSTSFTMNAGSATGAASVILTGGPFLREVYSVNLTGASSQAIGTLTMRNGNVVSDVEVGPTDIDAVIAAFGEQSGINANCDRDSEVGPVDIDVVVANFGEQIDDLP